jgi:hypothetical protein
MERGRCRRHGALPETLLARSDHACGESRSSGRRSVALDAGQKTLRRQLHETIQKVGDDFGRRHAFNTAIAALMELLNALNKFSDQSDQGRAVRHEALEAMVLLLNPVVPHISHALWQVLGHARGVLEDQPWPQADPAALVRDSVTLAVQINGKLRATIELAANASKEEAEALARAQPQVMHFLEGLSVRKVIVVPARSSTSSQDEIHELHESRPPVPSFAAAGMRARAGACGFPSAQERGNCRHRCTKSISPSAAVARFQRMLARALEVSGVTVEDKSGPGIAELNVPTRRSVPTR